MGLNQSVQWGNCSSVWKGSRQKILHLFRYIDEKNKQKVDLLGRSIATSFIPWWGARLVSGTEVVISTCSEKMNFIFIIQSVFKLHNTMFMHSSEMRGLYSIKICYILCIEKPWENPCSANLLFMKNNSSQMMDDIFSFPMICGTKLEYYAIPKVPILWK